jgi:hypothetical protein
LEAFDLARKLAYAGTRSPVPFRTGPEFTNSVPGVPVCSMIRLFVPREHWSLEKVQVAAKEVCRVLGSNSQFDVGFAVAGKMRYDADRPASGDTARLMKMDTHDRRVLLRIAGRVGDMTYQARFPQLSFEQTGEDFWRSLYAPGAVKDPAQP